VREVFTSTEIPPSRTTVSRSIHIVDAINFSRLYRRVLVDMRSFYSREYLRLNTVVSVGYAAENGLSPRHRSDSPNDRKFKFTWTLSVAFDISLPSIYLCGFHDE
jgi:hypothetical protein